ncbi:MAG: hypothetical protein ACK4NU_13150 [Brevundimonas sp.]
MSLIKTKTFWAGVSLVVLGCSKVIQKDWSGIEEILNGLGLIFLREAILKK